MNISASYSSGIVQVQGGKIIVRSVLDIKGRLVTSTFVSQNQFTFKNGVSGIYVLLIDVNNRVEALRIAIP